LRFKRFNGLTAVAAMKKDDETLSIIFNAQAAANEKDRMYWLWLGSAYSILRSRVPDIFTYQSDLERSYGAAKQIVMELWTIRAFLIKLKIGTDDFDKIIPNLKAFRDAIATLTSAPTERCWSKGNLRQ
jgi:hypothetical protein